MKKKAPITSANKKKPARRKPKSGKSFKKKIFLFILKAGIAAVLLVLLLFLVVYAGFTGPVPSTDELQQIKNPIATEVYAEDGELLGRYYVENRSYVSFKDISPNVINALVSTEDSRFYHHRGIDEVALLRVIFKTLLLQEHSSGGGSTLSQQIAKNLFPRKSFGMFSMPVNKLRESIIAYRLERLYTKEEILALYLNTVPFGENTYGIGVASERFFNKPPSMLTVHEAATLIGMLKGNNLYNPRKNPERSLERRNVVIDQMLKYGYLSVGEAKLEKEAPLGLDYNPITYNEGPAPYLMEKLRPVLQDWCNNHLKDDKTNYNLFTDGLKIKTTINFSMQMAAEKAVADQMKKLQALFDKIWGKTNPWGNDQSVIYRAMKRSDRYRSMKKDGASDEDIKAAFNTPETISLFGWDGARQQEMTPLDSIKYYLKILNTGFMAVNPNSGELKAYIGGDNFRYFKFDHVDSKRQVGSTFKPIVYLAALEAGISPDTYFANERKVYSEYGDWSPENSHDDYTGYYSMEGALAQSINTIAVDVLMKTGIDSVIDLAHRMGIRSDLPKYPSLALGVASVSLGEMVCAYSAIVNGGHRIEPYCLKSIATNSGEILEEFKNQQPNEQVASTENCRIVTQMLKGVVNEGTGSAIRTQWGIDCDFAGKTGTTQDQADGWFIGMTPDLVAGAWVGGEDPSIHFTSLGTGAGGHTALPIVGEFFSQILQQPKFRSMRNASFELPSEDDLALLNIPPYREILEVKGRGLLHELFGRKDNRETDLRKKKQIASEPPKEPELVEQPARKTFWQSVKDMFKKKNR